MKSKSIYIILTLLLFILFPTLGWYMTENGKPIMTKIEQAIGNYDGNFSKIITIELDYKNLFVFYETTIHTLKVVLVGTDPIGRVKVDGFLGETSLVHTERVASWYATGNGAPGDTELLYGIIFDPTITQLYLQSEKGQMAQIIKIDDHTALWYLFLDDDFSTPIILSALDIMGNELDYYGPQRE